MWLCSMAVVEAPWWHRGGCMCALNSCVCMAYPQQASCLTWTCVHALSPDGLQASDSGVLGMHVCRCLNISKYCLRGTKFSLTCSNGHVIPALLPPSYLMWTLANSSTQAPTHALICSVLRRPRWLHPRRCQQTGLQTRLAASALAGFNSTFIAYGQTGSGKTFSMGQPASIGSDSEGMAHRVSS